MPTGIMSTVPYRPNAMTQFGSLIVDQDDPPRLGGAIHLADVRGDWVAAWTKSNSEKRLAFDLLERNVPYYLPMNEVVTRSGNKRRVTLKPLFKGYVFCALPSADASVLFDTHRTLKVVRIQKQATFREQIENLDEALSRDPRMEPCPIVEGHRVKVMNGPFAGVLGIVIRREAGAIFVVNVGSFGAAVAELELKVDGCDLEVRALR